MQWCRENGHGLAISLRQHNFGQWLLVRTTSIASRGAFQPPTAAPKTSAFGCSADKCRKGQMWPANCLKETNVVKARGKSDMWQDWWIPVILHSCYPCEGWVLEGNIQGNILVTWRIFRSWLFLLGRPRANFIQRTFFPGLRNHYAAAFGGGVVGVIMRQLPLSRLKSDPASAQCSDTKNATFLKNAMPNQLDMCFWPKCRQCYHQFTTWFCVAQKALVKIFATKYWFDTSKGDSCETTSRDHQSGPPVHCKGANNPVMVGGHLPNGQSHAQHGNHIIIALDGGNLCNALPFGEPCWVVQSLQSQQASE